MEIGGKGQLAKFPFRNASRRIQLLARESADGLKENCRMHAVKGQTDGRQDGKGTGVRTDRLTDGRVADLPREAGRQDCADDAVACLVWAVFTHDDRWAGQLSPP